MKLVCRHARVLHSSMGISAEATTLHVSMETGTSAVLRV